MLHPLLLLFSPLFSPLLLCSPPPSQKGQLCPALPHLYLMPLLTPPPFAFSSEPWSSIQRDVLTFLPHTHTLLPTHFNCTRVQLIRSPSSLIGQITVIITWIVLTVLITIYWILINYNKTNFSLQLQEAHDSICCPSAYTNFVQYNTSLWRCATIRWDGVQWPFVTCWLFLAIIPTIFHFCIAHAKCWHLINMYPEICTQHYCIVVEEIFP